MSEQPKHEEWEVVRTVGTEEEARIIVGYLQANDLPAEVESVRFNQEPVNFGDMSEVRVRVPMEHRREALALLSERETADLSAEAEIAEAATEGTDPDDVPTDGGEDGEA